jgi:hypothetical protein
VTAALLLLIVQGSLGAFDTVYYHEYKAQLPAGGARTRLELWLHAVRDFAYATLFGTLPFVAWCGAWTAVLVGLIAFEIVVTMTDFAIEPRARAPADVLPGERVTHGLMAIVYGAALFALAPSILAWSTRPTAFAPLDESVPFPVRVVLPLMSAGVFLSGVRDAYAALGGPGGAFPWRASRVTDPFSASTSRSSGR